MDEGGGGGGVDHAATGYNNGDASVCMLVKAFVHGKTGRAGATAYSSNSVF